MGYTVMRFFLALTLLLSGAAACAQAPAQSALPDAPSTTLAEQQDAVTVAEAAQSASGERVKSCSLVQALRMSQPKSVTIEHAHIPCSELFNPYQQFLGTNVSVPLTPREKGYLAIHNLTAPASLVTTVAVSGFTIGIDSHTAYGPGWKGFGKSAGVSLLQNATGEFFGTFLIPTVAHQDPRYYRMAKGSIPRRFLHAVSRTVVAQNDDGSLMPNYATLLTYPISAELSNLYVPGIHADASSTMARIVTGLAIDPANNLIAEFLPDVARHINIRIIFVQRILNQVASEQSNAF
jgi:hypothetical protein